jgi:betaine/carnitine transporter, BCCT family
VPTEPRTDKPMFFGTFLLLVAACVPMFLWPKASERNIVEMYHWIANNLGILYQWAVIGIIVLLGWVGFGRHGSRVLGNPGDVPEFSTFSWGSMLFCGGVGAGLIYWATIEWGFYLTTPPFGITAGTDEARDWANAYGLFHWGPLAWLIYALPTLCIGYQHYVRGAPDLRFSTAVYGLFGHGNGARVAARVIDGLFMISILAGAGTAIALSVPMVSASMAAAVGLQRTLALDIGVVITSVTLLAIASWIGVSKGVKKLTDFNVYLAFAFLMFVLFAGPTLFILRSGTESLGFMLQNMLRMVTYTDPVHRTGFVEDWTIFYWAWWFSYGPFMGVFVTRISRGRTLREVIFSMAAYGSLGCALFFIILGNFSAHLDLTGALPVAALLQTQAPAETISSVIGFLPMGNGARVVFSVITVIFIAAAYNAKAYGLSASTSLDLQIGQDPARWNRVFWSLLIGLLPIAMLYVEGGLTVAKAAVLVASLPLLLIIGLMSVHLVRCLNEPAAS